MESHIVWGFGFILVGFFSLVFPLILPRSFILIVIGILFNFIWEKRKKDWGGG